MEMNETLFDKIEDYLRGKLPAEEAAAFEREIAADPELAEAVEMQRFEQDGLEFILEEKLRGKMEAWKTAPPPPGESPAERSWSARWLLMIGLLAAVAVAGWLYFSPKAPQPPGEQQEKNQQTPATPSPTAPGREQAAKPDTPASQPSNTESPKRDPRFLALAETSYRFPDHLGGTLKSAGQTAPANDPLSAGMNAYQAGKYEDAARIFDRLYAQDAKQNALAQEWAGHAWFQSGKKSGDFSKAAAIFKSIADKKTGDAAQDRAEWYLLLSLLPDYQQQKKKIKMLLKKMTLPENYHAYAEDAKKIQQQIDRLK